MNKRTLIKRLLGVTGEVFEWNELQKAQFVYAWIAGIALYTSALLFIVDHLPFLSMQGINHPMLSGLVKLAGCIGIFSASLFTAGFYIRKRWPDNIFYPHLCVQVFVLVNIILIYFLGLFSLPAGIALAGGPLTGMILFRRSVVFTALVTASIATTTLIYLTLQGQIDYAPIIMPQAAIPPHQDVTWLLIFGGISLPYLLLILTTAISSIRRWQVREEEIRFLSFTDALTQVPNRRHILDQIDMEISRAERDNTPVSVMMIDLDHFKKINDEHGHLSGDIILKKAAATLKDAIRKTDSVGRYGGEEFCILLPGTDLEGGMMIAERCRSQLEQAEVHSDIGKPLHISASIGLAALNLNKHSSVDDLLKDADDALYIAKEQGRNRVIPFQENAA